MVKAQKIPLELNKYFFVAVLALAFWPVLVWYVERTLDHSDEPWGLLSLATVVVLLVTKSARRHISVPLPAHEEDVVAEKSFWKKSFVSSVAGTFTLLVYIVTYRAAPHLVQSVLLVLAVWFLIVEKFSMPSRAGIFGLLLLALPVIPSLNFYAGYPVRFVVAAGTVLLFGVLGISATQEGTVLSINQHLISIDAPCGGINMLWTEAYAVMLLASLFGLNFKKTSLLTLSACALITVGNVLRASTLIIYDLMQFRQPNSIMSQSEPLVHVSVGLFYFCLVTGAIAYLSQKLASDGSPTSSEGVPSNPAAPKIDEVDEPVLATPAFALQPVTPTKRPAQNVLYRTDLAHRILIVLCAVSTLLPFLAHPTKGSNRADPPPTWPALINGASVTPVESLKEEQAFASDFPGYMKRFTDGSSAYFVRCVYRDTRQLHPSSDCFKGLGYSIEPRPLSVGEDGQRWSCFEVTKSMHKYLVMERIYDSAGKSWTDVSEWYWAAASGESTGPWFAITIAKPIGIAK